MTNGATSVCGSSLLTNTRLVTAAHCWFDGRNQAREFTVVMGSTRLFFGGTRVVTSNVEVHSSYNPSNLNNDIAMITTAWITYNDNIRPINLPSGSLLNDNFAGTWAQAAGFGRTSDSTGITTDQFLSHVNLQVITNSVCQMFFGSAVVTSTLCTSGAGGTSTCGGDSGGPLSINNGGNTVLGGLVISLTTGETSVCGSSLLTNTRLVTAAHCWFDGRNQARQFTVVMGSTHLFYGGTRIVTSDVEVHSSYNPSNLNNDIALITTGWITYNAAGISSNQFLSYVNLQVIDHTLCRIVYGSSTVLSSTLCTSGAGGTSTCGGDSDGPLSINNGGNTVLLDKDNKEIQNRPTKPRFRYALYIGCEFVLIQQPIMVDTYSSTMLRNSLC
ncbi:unnamed protein product [Parnassius apollo]|uniref:(apollo) hypothetical protein n=1 Tax=Parnassius apollo TaxID=110799 RepID=A0A8S3W2U3_PARAO|nr:unnamed protein product [Parnassius apollo]